MSGNGGGSAYTPPQPPPNQENSERWGTHIMGVPAVPSSHPNNHTAAMLGVGGASDGDQYHHPYLQYTPVPRAATSPMESVLHKFNSWSNKAEITANNIWRNLKTGPSVSEAAWAKVNLTAKAISGGGFETLFKQTFQTNLNPNEKLNKTFACYLSTTTGPVPGTLYLSNLHLAFCSDRPLSFTAPSAQQTWSYYKIMIPLGKIGTINPVNTMMGSQTQKYIQAVTIDGQDFWFMGFVNYEKACHHLLQSVSSFAAFGIPVVHQRQGGVA